eukprot:5095765-Amphidinium_carterae.1
MRRIESCLTCEWLGNTLFGVDVDDVFQYETTKVAVHEPFGMAMLSAVLCEGGEDPRPYIGPYEARTFTPHLFLHRGLPVVLFGTALRGIL